MKKFLAILLAFLALTTFACAEEAEPEFVEVPLDAALTVSGNFSAKFVVTRGASDQLDGGLTFYRSGDTYLGFNVRRVSDDRVDFYGTKFIDGKWMGFLIAEENQEWLKDCYVSVDDGWDATTDTNITVTVIVKDGMATVTAQGDVTGKSGTLHFDLTKSPWFDWEERETEPLQLTEGALMFSFVGGEAVQLFVDADTYAANQQ